MSAKFDYTSSVRRFATKHPALSYVGIQINFWVIANALMGMVIHFHSIYIAEAFDVPIHSRIKPIILLSVLLGILYGTVLGTTDYYLDKHYFKKISLGKIFIVKTIISLGMSLFVFGILSTISFEMDIPSLLPSKTIFANMQPWKYMFYLFMIFYLLMTLLIGFINQVNKKYGPGVLIPLILGKYRNPIEEERIFMFMDLKSSTTIAEVLGHINYSAFIRDSFWDINQVLSPYNAEVYQYVGDEIVVSWKVDDGLQNDSCVQFFFGCEDQFLDRAEYYNNNYGFFPEFKAGLHMGKITAVEIGDVKRDIAYHGDTINTTARIQSVCNQFGKNFLVSEYLLEKSGLRSHFKIESLGMIQLKGKLAEIGIASIERISSAI